MRVTISCVAVLLVVIASSDHSKFASVAQSPDGTRPRTEYLPLSSLDFDISSPGTGLILLQPIPLKFKLTNNKNGNARGCNALGFAACPINVYIRRSDSDSRIILSPLTPIHEFKRYTLSPLRPGEVVEGRELITLGLERFFSQPGDYEIQAVIANQDGTERVESNMLMIHISEPTGLNRNAYNLIKSKRFQEYLFSGTEFDRTKSTLEMLTTTYRSTPYARNAAFLLGETYFHERQFALAIANLSLLENDNDFIFADRVRNYLAEIRGNSIIGDTKIEKP